MNLRSETRVRIFIPALCLGFLLLISKPVSGQQFSLGLKGGASMTWTRYPDKDHRALYDTKGKFGFFGAGFISFPLKKDYSCVIEGGYSQRGRKVAYGSDGSTFTQLNEAKYYYYDGVLLLRKSFNMNLIKNVPTHWFVNVGPRISRWVSGEGKFGNIEDPIQRYTIKFDEAEDPSTLGSVMYLNGVNRWLFSLDIGVGFDAPLSKTQRLIAELRFQSGHTFFGGDLSANVGGVPNFDDRNLRANEKVLSFSLAYIVDFDLQRAKAGKSTKDKEVHRKPVKKKKR